MALTRRKASRPSTPPPARSGVEERNLTWTATLRPGADIVGPFGGLSGPYGLQGQTPLDQPSPAALAAAEAASGMIERAVGSGQVSAPPLARPAITNRLLSTIVRGMLFRGEQAVWLSLEAGRVKLRPCWHQFYSERPAVDRLRDAPRRPASLCDHR